MEDITGPLQTTTVQRGMNTDSHLMQLMPCRIYILLSFVPRRSFVLAGFSSRPWLLTLQSSEPIETAQREGMVEASG